MKTRYLILLLIVFSYSCKKNEETEIIVNSPSITVLKFLNAEGFADIKGAKKFFDTKTVFSENEQPVNLPKTVKIYEGLDTIGKNRDEFGWEWHLKFFHENAIKNGNTTSHLDIYNYNITEKIENKTAEVKIIPLNKKVNIQYFKLEQRKNKWIIIKREYLEK